MLRVGIVDDEELWLEKLSQDIRNILDKEEVPSQVISLKSAKALEQEFLDGVTYDLLFLDIQMPNMDGIQLGQKVRQVWEDKRTLLVYVSAYPDLAYKGINNEVIGFIEKGNYEPGDLEQILRRARRKLSKEKKYFIFYKKKQKSSIDIEKILYFLKEGRKVKMRIFEGDFQDIYLSGNLKKVKKDLGQEFLQINQSTIIHRIYGKDLGRYRVRMKDGIEFQVGRTYQKDFWGVGR